MLFEDTGAWIGGEWGPEFSFERNEADKENKKRGGRRRRRRLGRVDEQREKESCHGWLMLHLYSPPRRCRWGVPFSSSSLLLLLDTSVHVFLLICKLLSFDFVMKSLSYRLLTDFFFLALLFFKTISHTLQKHLKKHSFFMKMYSLKETDFRQKVASV